MALGDKVQQSGIIPDPSGKGNEVFLQKMPYFQIGEGTQLDSVIFEFTEPKYNSLGKLSVLDFHNGRTDKESDGLMSRLCHVYGALMTAENYDKFVMLNETLPMEEIVEFGNKLIHPDIMIKKMKVLFGFNKSGYITVPAYGDVISSEFKLKNLLLTTKTTLTLVPGGGKSPDSEGNDANLL